MKIDRLKIAGDSLQANVTRAIVGVPSLSLGTTKVGDLSITLSDERWNLLASGLFAGRPAADLDDIPLEVTAIETGGGSVETLKLSLRSRGMQALSRDTTPVVRRGLSPTQFVQIDAAAHGLAFVGEPSASRTQIARGDTEDEATDPESAAKSARRLADELGFWMFEVAGTVWFGRPSWLMARSGLIVWKVGWRGSAGKQRDAVAAPSCRRSDDADQAATIDLDLPHAIGEQLRPGHAIDLSGVPTFSGRYLVTEVSIPLDDVGDVAVTAETPVDPEPQPATDTET